MLANMYLDRSKFLSYTVLCSLPQPVSESHVYASVSPHGVCLIAGSSVHICDLACCTLRATIQLGMRFVKSSYMRFQGNMGLLGAPLTGCLICILKVREVHGWAPLHLLTSQTPPSPPPRMHG